MYLIEISNITTDNFNLPLPLVDTKGNRFLRDVDIPACALNVKIQFTNEDEFKRWRDNYKEYFDGDKAVLKIGKSSGHSIEKRNEELEKVNAEKIKADSKRIDSKDEEVGIKTQISETQTKKSKK